MPGDEVLFGGVPVMSFKEFLLEGFWQNALAWLTVLLFLGVPIIALITWLIRRIMGVRSKNHYLGYVFGTLWFIGIMSAALLVGSVFRNFRSEGSAENDFAIVQPSSGKLFLFLIKVLSPFFRVREIFCDTLVRW